MSKRWSDILRIDESAAHPIRDLTERIMLANAKRLERQAEALLRRGYRVEELENIVREGSLREPPQLNGTLLSATPWGDISPRSGGPSDIRLVCRRAWRIIRPYNVAPNQIQEPKP